MNQARFISVIATRRQEVLAQQQAAADRTRSLRRELRSWREQETRLAAELALLDLIGRECGNGEQLPAGLNVPNGAKMSARIAAHLASTRDGMTVGELVQVLGDARPAMVSATLYNMKRRGDVLHSPTTGKHIFKP